MTSDALDILRKAALPIIGAIILIGLIMISFSQCSKARVAGAETRVATKQGEATSANGSDAIATVGAAQRRDETISTITEENDRAIKSAPGADAPVDPAVAAAGRRGLCRYAANRGKPECVQRAAPQ